MKTAAASGYEDAEVAEVAEALSAEDASIDRRLARRLTAAVC